jgi:hypothetical protein
MGKHHDPNKERGYSAGEVEAAVEKAVQKALTTPAPDETFNHACGALYNWKLCFENVMCGNCPQAEGRLQMEALHLLANGKLTDWAQRQTGFHTRELVDTNTGNCIASISNGKFIPPETLQPTPGSNQENQKPVSKKRALGCVVPAIFLLTGALLLGSSLNSENH